MEYVSINDQNNVINGVEAILYNNYGLYAPKCLPLLTREEIEALGDLSFSERVAYFLHLFFDEFDYEFLKETCKNAYAKFNMKDCAQLVKINFDEFFLELYHGKGYNHNDLTAAILPSIIGEAAKIKGISGKIHLISFGAERAASLSNTKNTYSSITVTSIYDKATSTEEMDVLIESGDRKNTVVPLKGINLHQLNRIKKLADDNVKNGTAVFWDAGSLISIIVKASLFAGTYSDLVSNGAVTYGDRVNFALPLSCFSDLISCQYAKRMGIPINKIVCAVGNGSSIPIFLESGEYKNKATKRNITPFMLSEMTEDFPLFVFELTYRNYERTKKYVDLANNGDFIIDGYPFISSDLFSSSSADNDLFDFVYEYFEEYGYLMDPNTASAVCSAADYSNSTDDMSPVVYVSTSSPYLYLGSTFFSLYDEKPSGMYRSAKKIFEISGMVIPKFILSCEPNENNKTILNATDVDASTLLAILDSEKNI